MAYSAQFICPSTVLMQMGLGLNSGYRLFFHAFVCRGANFEQMVERKTERKIKRDGG